MIPLTFLNNITEERYTHIDYTVQLNEYIDLCLIHFYKHLYITYLYRYKYLFNELVLSTEVSFYY